MIESSPPSRTGERRWRDDLHLAHTIADQVDPLTQAHFDNQDFEIETKPDLTPVTVADREAEWSITDTLHRVFPEALVVGEEAVFDNPALLAALPAAGHAFVVDPVDGTRNFVRGSPDH
mgnify:CR=1 FL=1